MPQLSIDGASLYYSETGTGDPLVLVHGTGGSADVWDQVVSLLAPRFRTIAYDRRGHQRSSGKPPAVREYFARHAQDLLALLEGLKATPATVLAWSAGSFVALHATLMKPNHIKHLVLYEPPFHVKKNITWMTLKTFALIGLNQALRRPEHAANIFRRMVMAYTDGRNTMNTLSSTAWESMQRDTSALLAELGAGTGEELSPAALADQIKIPVSLLAGERSPALFTAALERMRNIFPRAPLRVIPGANHFAQFDSAREFAQAALAMCEGAQPSAQADGPEKRGPAA